MSPELQLRTLHSVEEMGLVKELEEIIWKWDAVPVHQTLTAIRNGGLMLGAFLDGKLVGFSYSFPGFLNGKVYLCSHTLGIHPDHREKGIGYKLKERQKTEAEKMGYDMLTWTYDPLESRNAYLNLSKLRSICNTYIVNSYGNGEDELNKGLPTDRFKVEWWINSGHVENPSPIKIDESSAFRVPHEKGEGGLPRLGDVDLSFSAKQISAPVPAFFQQMKKEDLGLAADWRMKTRTIFQRLFDAGYTAVSLIRNEDAPVHHYLLVKRSELQLDEATKR